MLHHMAYVKEGGVGSCEMVRGADGEGAVLDWHLEPAKWDHLSTVSDVEVVEGGFAESGGGGFMADRGKGSALGLELSWRTVGGEGFRGGRGQVFGEKSCGKLARASWDCAVSDDRIADS